MMTFKQPLCHKRKNSLKNKLEETIHKKNNKMGWILHLDVLLYNLIPIKKTLVSDYFLYNYYSIFKIIKENT